MRFSMLLFFLVTGINRGHTQVLDQYRQLCKTSQTKDTITGLVYQKEINASLAGRLDSFETYRQQLQEDDKQEKYFYTVNFQSRPNGLYVAIAYNALYIDYLLLTDLATYKHLESTFAYSFFRGKLVLFTTSNRNINIDNCALEDLKNLIYDHLPASEQIKIRQKPDVVEVITQPVKGYYIEKAQ